MAQQNRDIGITMGDPSGVGPELVAALIDIGPASALARSVIFADRIVLERAFTQRTGRRLPDTVEIVDRGLLSADQAVPGQPSEAGAQAQVGYLEAAAKYANSGQLAAIVTGPVSKTQCKRSGLDFPGQTEFFKSRLGADKVAMLFAGPVVNVVLATSHVPLTEVSANLGADGLATTIDLALAAMERDFGIDEPKIGVLGLNPHAGEDGLLGSEEADVIGPAIEAAAARHRGKAHFEGPLVPDAAFRREVLERVDLLVAMYHDQALIPLKLLDFDHTVNVTIGLPVVRTSPDHGVAYDIAGQGKARPHSFLTAVARAIEMSERRAQG
ncbi:MAG: 4-hydroxythreonine-4-phosphate dehydrogenase PdxA [Deltaproteobacteria bacterium]|nr:4-hydroxythreonine-4-phosphate dehydrogenase PdxA [Deltaproteobacteria bacterium]